MVVVLQLGHAFAQATSAGTHSPAPAPAHAPAPAPAPGPSAYGCYTALNVLEASSQYTTLLSLLDSTDLTSYFDNLNHFITVFAPTNAGIQSTLNGFGTTLAKFANSTAVTAVLEYHLLPSPVLVTALQNGNSFNTMFTQNAQVQTISVNRTSTYITVEGFFSNANVTSTGTQACGLLEATSNTCQRPIYLFILIADGRTYSEAITGDSNGFSVPNSGTANALEDIQEPLLAYRSSTKLLKLEQSKTCMTLLSMSKIPKQEQPPASPFTAAKA
ncbi:MAG: hypothetical protein FRX49_12687 [Trebouxia sp. A1-2]|nr:MAG: hypothetical protein FRX49_12687 [Trebouxia sp. A1-2]